MEKSGHSYDVVVIGGGLGGIAASIAASKQGAKVLLVERYGYLGGMATVGLVNPFMKYTNRTHFLASPIFREMLERLDKAGALGADKHVFDDEVLKWILDSMVLDHGVDVLFHSYFSQVIMHGSTIKSTTFHGKSGRLDISGKIFIDASGDGDVAVAAGAPFSIGREVDNECQPMTLCFRVAGITGDLAARDLTNELNDIFLEAKEKGIIEQPREDVLLFRTLISDVYHFNTTRVFGNASNSRHLTNAEIEGRRQVMELFKLFKERSSRFSNAYLLKMATQIGVRETRHIKGEYTLTEEDVLSCRKFYDGIARANYPIDIHNPSGSGTILKHLPEDDFYEIPYRCSVPIGVDNLLVASRCISATHEAHSSMRVMPIVMSIGEAIGMAGGQAAVGGTTPRYIEGAEIKEQLFGKETHSVKVVHK